METLSEIYQRHIGRRGTGDRGTAHSYIDTYEELLAPYRKGSAMLEIGSTKESIEMWEEYFKDCLVFGIDVRVVPNHSNVFVCDCTDKHDMDDVLDGNVSWNIVIDDASHVLEAQVQTFKIMESKLDYNALYIIEDIPSKEHAEELIRRIDPSAEYNAQIIDLRLVKGRFDDMMLVLTKSELN